MTETATASEQLSRQDLNDIWWLLDYHGTKMWPPEKAKRLADLIKAAEKVAAQ
jgi:hypothetical protein